MPAYVRYNGPFMLDPASFRVMSGQAAVPLTPKAFEILALLVRERRRALTKQELFDAVWPNTAVTENTLTQRIKEIREALGDRAQESVYIRTLPRVGFQFVAEAEMDAESAVEGALPAAGPPPRTSVPGVPAAAPEPVDRAGRFGNANARAWRRRLTAAVAIAIVATAAVLIDVTRRAGPAPETEAPNRRVMLAILPFENLSGNPEQAHIGDGLTEEMIAELGDSIQRTLA